MVSSHQKAQLSITCLRCCWVRYQPAFEFPQPQWVQSASLKGRFAVITRASECTLIVAGMEGGVNDVGEFQSWLPHTFVPLPYLLHLWTRDEERSLQARRQSPCVCKTCLNWRLSILNTCILLQRVLISKVEFIWCLIPASEKRVTEKYWRPKIKKGVFQINLTEMCDRYRYRSLKWVGSRDMVTVLYLEYRISALWHEIVQLTNVEHRLGSRKQVERTSWKILNFQVLLYYLGKSTFL